MHAPEERHVLNLDGGSETTCRSCRSGGFLEDFVVYKHFAPNGAEFVKRVALPKLNPRITNVDDK
jgi:hypothetical protein